MLLARDHLNRDVILKLYAYTDRKMNKARGSAIYSRFTSNEIAHDAILKTLSNERPWNSEKCPNLFVHLAGCAKSIMSNQKNLMEIKSTDLQDNLDCHYEKQRESQSIIEPDSMHLLRSNRSASFTPEEIQSALSDFKFLMDYLTKNRDDLISLADALLVHEISKPQELASYLGINVSKVNAKKVALKRILKRMQEGQK